MAPEGHLTPEQTAGYLDRTLGPAERAEIEAHLAACLECRDEVVALQPLVSPRVPRKAVGVGVGLAAAAAAAVILIVHPTPESGRDSSAHRDLPQAADAVIAPRTPAGAVTQPVVVTWSALDNARRYRVMVFDAEGMVLYRVDGADTAVPLPDSLRLSPGQTYFWKVEADTGWDRWVSSTLVEFRVSKGRPPR
jgi:hypothetical protein